MKHNILILSLCAWESLSIRGTPSGICWDWGMLSLTSYIGCSSVSGTTLTYVTLIGWSVIHAASNSRVGWTMCPSINSSTPAFLHNKRITEAFPIDFFIVLWAISYMWVEIICPMFTDYRVSGRYSSRALMVMSSEPLRFLSIVWCKKHVHASGTTSRSTTASFLGIKVYCPTMPRDPISRSVRPFSPRRDLLKQILEIRLSELPSETCS